MRNDMLNFIGRFEAFVLGEFVFLCGLLWLWAWGDGGRAGGLWRWKWSSILKGLKRLRIKGRENMRKGKGLGQLYNRLDSRRTILV